MYRCTKGRIGLLMSARLYHFEGNTATLIASLLCSDPRSGGDASSCTRFSEGIESTISTCATLWRAEDSVLATALIDYLFDAATVHAGLPDEARVMVARLSLLSKRMATACLSPSTFYSSSNKCIIIRFHVCFRLIPPL